MENHSYRKNALIIGILLGMIFVLSLLLLHFLPAMQKSGPLAALVYQDSILIHTIDLSNVTEEYQLNISDGKGQYNIVQVRPGAIGITEANCPDKLCVHMGFRDSTLLPITCLPHRLVIRIVSDASLSGQRVPLDGITY
ncbi:MAG: NusG domain II-containing protein [Lachnospiraceae bacterium]|nr:NusG domain II-containing protein [Lachnospiraceae bacterium]